jgi:hypothetical protein
MILTRDALARELERLKAYWPNMPATPQALDGYFDALRGYEDVEVSSGVTLLLSEYDAPAAPKPKHLKDYAGRIAKHRRGDVTPVGQGDDASICSRCGTKTLVEAIDHTRERLQWRLWPQHAPTCPLVVDFPESFLEWPPRETRSAA